MTTQFFVLLPPSTPIKFSTLQHKLCICFMFYVFSTKQLCQFALCMYKWGSYTIKHQLFGISMSFQTVYISICVHCNRTNTVCHKYISFHSASFIEWHSLSIVIQNCIQNIKNNVCYLHEIWRYWWLYFNEIECISIVCY